MPASGEDSMKEPRQLRQDLLNNEELNHNNLLTRVANYASPWYEAAKFYYSSAKDKSTLVKYSCETMESSLEKGYKWVQPKVEPVLHTESVTNGLKYCEPIFVKVDEFGCKQLDRIESLHETVKAKEKELKEVVSSFKTGLVSNLNTEAVSTSIEKVVPTVDNYLRESMLGTPLKKALDVTEAVYDRYLGSPDVEGVSREMTIKVGPVVRAGKLTKKMQRQAFQKLKGLTLRSSEAINGMPYVVDLIHYAATNLDSGRKTANQFIETSITKGKQISVAGVNYIAEKRQKVSHLKLKEVGQQVHTITASSINALISALEELYQHPLTISFKTLDILKQRTKNFTIQLESVKDLAVFSAVATTSATKLNELSQFISTSKGTVLSNQTIATIVNSLHSILDNLISIQSNKVARVQDGEEVHEEQKIPSSNSVYYFSVLKGYISPSNGK